MEYLPRPSTRRFPLRRQHHGVAVLLAELPSVEHYARLNIKNIHNINNKECQRHSHSGAEHETEEHETAGHEAAGHEAA
jgi:hypothetical protein